jgi:hypothetical protein
MPDSAPTPEGDPGQAVALSEILNFLRNLKIVCASCPFARAHRPGSIGDLPLPGPAWHLPVYDSKDATRDTNGPHQP